MDLLSLFSESWWSFRKEPDIRPFVLKHKREGAVAPGRYGLWFWRGVPATSRDDIFRDAEYTVVLFKRTGYVLKDTLACVGFNVREQGVIEVVQLQGVRGRESELRALRWDRMLLEIVVSFAGESGFKEVLVQASARNKWLLIIDPLVKPGLTATQKAFHLRYDVLPKRMGFTLGKDYHTLHL